MESNLTQVKTRVVLLESTVYWYIIKGAIGTFIFAAGCGFLPGPGGADGRLPQALAIIALEVIIWPLSSATVRVRVKAVNYALLHKEAQSTDRYGLSSHIG